MIPKIKPGKLIDTFSYLKGYFQGSNDKEKEMMKAVVDGFKNHSSECARYLAKKRWGKV